ncbi:MAG: B12-binding domain-containing radical SAM protein [Deltaproteobacteria bacterium]|nr:B12-binding domain-containing radical SAM protein [Deltaproteobacteria bacterium]MBW2302548.1 B12-binding domain-containing radical SAM protein [Deltaproteobacteria bacterium]
MNILLVYPRYPDTFWSFRYALKFISKKAVHPPLGLLTIAAMLPEKWEKKLIDMNVEALGDQDLEWADYVFISAMAVQKASVLEIIRRCNKIGVKIVAGGPLFTAAHEDFKGIDHFVLNEAEITLPRFLADLEKGVAGPVYRTGEFPDLKESPVPRWDLVRMKKYASMNIQYSRGCPFNCDFCDITVLYGRKVRTKSAEQILRELEILYQTGWRGNVFIVDDNFIGNKVKLKKEVLPAIIQWMKKRRYPFTFSTEASIDLADDDTLMRMMVRAGFDAVFVGIETPDEESLSECNKFQNKDRDLVACVKRIQAFGLQVQGGFIVGFDNDSPSIFQRQIDFIQKSGIITAMVGLLNAPRGSRLYERIVKQGRLLEDITGDNTDLTTNILPKMGYESLLNGYKKIISGIYSPRPYYERVKRFLAEYRPLERKPYRLHYGHIRFHSSYPWALFRSIWMLGIKDRGRVQYWKLFFWSLFRRPRLFPLAITYAIYGFHFRKVFKTCLET